ncbi:MAG: hypothetical protein JOS17DRAFT_763503 [Linnemannia elongata]|nr:MAG: hypothetical protein JOS17DRAFT_763503 [Linnemannia elongata]
MTGRKNACILILCSMLIAFNKCKTNQKALISVLFARRQFRLLSCCPMHYLPLQRSFGIVDPFQSHQSCLLLKPSPSLIVVCQFYKHPPPPLSTILSLSYNTRPLPPTQSKTYHVS